MWGLAYVLQSVTGAKDTEDLHARPFSQVGLFIEGGNQGSSNCVPITHHVPGMH